MHAHKKLITMPKLEHYTPDWGTQIRSPWWFQHSVINGEIKFISGKFIFQPLERPDLSCQITDADSHLTAGHAQMIQFKIYTSEQIQKRDARRLLQQQLNKISSAAESLLSRIQEFDLGAKNTNLLPQIEWRPATRTVRSGLLEQSHGDGNFKKTVVHIMLKEPIRGRLRREAGDLLCTPRKAKMWDKELNPTAAITCQKCLEMASRMKENKAGDPPADGQAAFFIDALVTEKKAIGEMLMNLKKLIESIHGAADPQHPVLQLYQQAHREHERIVKTLRSIS